MTSKLWIAIVYISKLSGPRVTVNTSRAPRTYTLPYHFTISPSCLAFALHIRIQAQVWNKKYHSFFSVDSWRHQVSRSETDSLNDRPIGPMGRESETSCLIWHHLGLIKTLYLREKTHPWNPWIFESLEILKSGLLSWKPETKKPNLVDSNFTTEPVIFRRPMPILGHSEDLMQHYHPLPRHSWVTSLFHLILFFSFP